MATQTDPVQQLAAFINRLYDLSDEPELSAGQQKALTVQAHALRGYLVELVSLRLNAQDAEYQELMANVAAATATLNETEQTIQKYIAALATVADITGAVDNLLQQAVALGTTAAKLAVA